MKTHLLVLAAVPAVGISLTASAAFAYWTGGVSGTPQASATAASLGAPVSVSAGTNATHPSTSLDVTVTNGPSSPAATGYAVYKSGTTTPLLCSAGSTLPSTCTASGLTPNVPYQFDVYSTRSNWTSASYATTTSVITSKQNTTTALSNLTTSGTARSAFSATATVTGRDGYGTPAGTVVFSLYTASDCSGNASYTTSAQALSSSAATGSLAPTAAGTYYWGAAYTVSDTYNNGSAVCGTASPVTVTGAATLTASGPLGPSIAKVGDTVSLSGTGFSATKAVSILFNGAAPSTSSCGNTTAAGALPSTCTFVVPTTADSLTNTVKVTVNGASATTNLVTYSVPLTFDSGNSPNPVWPGQTGVSLDAPGSSPKFQGGCSSVSATFDGSTLALTRNTGTNQPGSMGSANDAFTVPGDLAAGSSHYITFADCASPTANIGAVVYTVPSAGIVINPGSGSHSSAVPVTVYGTGFTAGAALTVKLDNTSKATVTATAINGAVPPMTISVGTFPSSGPHSVSVTDGTHSYSTTYTAS